MIPIFELEEEVDDPPASKAPTSMTSEGDILAVTDRVAEAIYGQIFDDVLGPVGTIERAIYREAATAGLKAGVNIWREFHKKIA